MSYTFKVGEKVKFKTWSDYTSRGISPWALLIVAEVGQNGYARVLLDEKIDEPALPVPVSDLQPPLGFQDVYKIAVGSPEHAAIVWSYLKERGGVMVWTCLDLSRAGHMMYTPATVEPGGAQDAEQKPHWSMGFVETVTDPTRIKLLVEIQADKKPDPKERHKWHYDKSLRQWWRTEEWKPA